MIVFPSVLSLGRVPARVVSMSLEEQTIHLGVRLLRAAEREALVEMIESGRIESTEKAAEAARAE